MRLCVMLEGRGAKCIDIVNMKRASERHSFFDRDQPSSAAASSAADDLLSNTHTHTHTHTTTPANCCRLLTQCNVIQCIIMPPTSIGKSIMKWVPVSVCLSSACCVPQPNSTTVRPTKPKIGKMEAHRTSNSWTYLEVKRSDYEPYSQLISTHHA